MGTVFTTEWNQKNVDLNWFNGTYDELLQLCGIDEIPPQGDNGMYETNALGIYLSADRKVTDYDRLVKDVDTVFLRCAFVPLQKHTDGNYYNFPDAAKTDDDLLKEDPSYKDHFTKIREASTRLGTNTKIIAVAEFNPAYAKDYSYSVPYQAQQVKRILNGSGNYIADAFCSQIMIYQWVEGIAVKTITGSNFKLAVENFFHDIYNELNQTVFGWSQSTVLKQQMFVANFTAWLDNANRGEATWPFGFTYLPVAWKNIWTTSVNSIREAVDLAPILTTSEVDISLRIGSYTGWMSKTQTNYNHSFWGLFGCKVPYIVNATGTPTMIEPIIFDTDWETLNDVDGLGRSRTSC